MSPAREIETVAASWLMRREEPHWSHDDEAQLQAWLDESHAHKAAFWRPEYGWRAADRIRALGPAPAGFEPKRRAAVRGWQQFAIAASVAALALAIPGALYFTSSAPASVSNYQTPLGGHQQVALVDGSTVELNTATAIRTAVSKARRDIWLDKGEAFFSVRHLGVPFVVHAGPRTVTVLGTKFSVTRDGDQVRVAVIEGRVRVSDANTSERSPTATITRGDILQAQGGSTLVLQDAEPRVERSLAWRDGLLQFDATPLSDAAAEFNRYNQRKIVVTGTAGTIPIGGSFKASNVNAFARLLHEAYGLQVEKTATETKISS
jgi:transmembrane sensor